MIKFFDISRQNAMLKDELNRSIGDVVSGGRYILGEKVADFEAKFADYIGTRYAIGVANGTDALKLSLMAAGVAAGDEVITVSNTAFPTILAISNIGAVPVFVDVGDDYCIDTEKIQAKITNNTRAIIPVHLYGNPCGMKALSEISEKHSIPMIEDACQAHGAEYHGRKTGTFGLTGAFSFYPTKNLGCFGDGGAITTDDYDLAEKIKMLRNCGQSNRERYVHPCLGMNSRLDEIQAAILNVKLKHLDEWNSSRIKIAGLYRKNIHSNVLLPPAGTQKHVYHLFVIRSQERERLAAHMKENGIETMVHYPIPAHMQEPFFHGVHHNLGNTEKLSKEILSLPIYPELNENEIERVCGAINSFK